ncbi:MAG TPA: glycosyl hydrolase family 65 protein [Jatrophihabitantaceae bacterium]|nr:glycosyl hydrolase family 65 protein [Jatrophihabitantaceae bacterium]
MIPEPRFPVEQWSIRELGLDLDQLAQSESVFALSNGHIGIRGNLDEGDPHGLPGTYLNSFYETRPLPYAESGYGFPEMGQTIINVTDGKLIRLLVDDEPFDLRYGTLHHHERILDLRSGLLHRVVEWESPAGQVVRVRSTRLVSLTQRSIMAIRYEVEAVSHPARVVIQSELVANEELPTQSSDPRMAAVLESPLEAEDQFGKDTRALLVHRTRSSQLRMAAAMENTFVGSGTPSLEIQPDWARVTGGTTLAPGERLTLTKFVAYGWSSLRSLPALRDQVDGALSMVAYTGWDQLVADQRSALDEFWHGADVSLEGDDTVQQAVRFGLFHTMQAAARAEGRAIPAKGLTGPGYDGHAFWDTESFVLPVLTATVPKAAADALRWRHDTLDLARDRAEALRMRGATFPWRTIRGHECSGYWPASTAAMHVNADIAAAAIRYVNWTGDEDFDRTRALPMLVETARLWASAGYHGDDGYFHLDGVTGPDEYSAVADDNIYTNLMARLNLLGAADTAERWPREAANLDVTAAETAAWRAAAEAMSMPYDDDKRVHQQDRGFTQHQVWDFERTAKSGGYPLLLHAPYFDIYRKQVVKQADLVLAMHWCGDRFTFEEKARAFAYYEPLTVRDSSLSACTQAVLAAETGHLELAHDYLAEAALMDLADLEHNSRDGLHIASLAGAWIALVAGFGGMRDHGGTLSFHPQLPPGITRLSFAMRWRGATLQVAVTPEAAVYTRLDGPAIEIQHGDDTFTLDGAPVTRPVQQVTPITPTPQQPADRAPARSS